MVDQRLTLRLELVNGEFVGGMRVSGAAVVFNFFNYYYSVQM